jgi:hypothetical protein
VKVIKNIKKHLLIIGVLLSVACLAYGQYNPPPQNGDYRNTQSTATITAVTNWQMYDGANWVIAPQPLAAYQPAFTGNIYADYNMTVNADFTMGGNIYSPNAGTSVSVAEGKTFTLSSGCTYQLRRMTVSKLARFVNHGTVVSAESTSKITLSTSQNMDEGGVLENHGSIEIQDTLEVYQYAKVISKQSTNFGATIHGGGSIDASAYGVKFEIANKLGYDEAVALTGNHFVTKACFTFNGDQPQVTGNKLPSSVFSIDVMGGQTLTLSRQVNMWGNNEQGRGDPYVRVHNGSTLDVKGNLIYSYGSTGVCTFFLDSGATIVTAHSNGISSNIVSGRINSGSIQTNKAVYSSGANYIFNGTGPTGTGRQSSGAFTTTPTAKTVNNIINESSSMLKLDNSFRPLNVAGGYLGNINTDSSVSGEGYIVGELLTLPVEMSYFSAVFNGFNSVMLQWETQSETNNLGFYVLRANEFEPASTCVISDLIQAANTSQGATYCFTDDGLYEDGLYYYWLQDVSFSGEVAMHGPIMVQVTLQSGSNQAPDLPWSTSLVRNYPNPFNPSTQLEYYLENGSDVDFKVYNLKGQLVDQFTLRNQNSGFHRYTWEPQFSSGVYLIRFTADGKSNSRKVILSK